MADEITLKDAFDGLMDKVRFDSHKAKSARLYQVEFVHANQDHRAFFGGNLIGVHRVRFAYGEVNRFFTEVVGIDDEDITTSVRAVTTINHEFKISGDIMNLTIAYMVHRYLTTPYLNEKDRYRAAKDMVLIFLYRTIAALLATFFKYPIDTETAQAVYERLSGRYLIKKLGTWQAVFEYRADEFLSKDSPHIDSMIAFKDDVTIVNAINDLQGRLRDMLKNIYSEFIYIHEHGGRIGSGSATMVDADGEEIVKDRIHGLESYQTYLLSVMEDSNSFYKQELVDVIIRVIPTIHAKVFPEVLRWMSGELSTTHRKEVINFSNHILMMAFNYLLENNYVLHRSKDIVLLTSKLKGYILSSRSDTPDLIFFREHGDNIIKTFIPHISKQTISALRNGLFLYVALRAFTKHAYSY